MTQETNNEIDLLLRRLGRQSDAPASRADGDHLDADELSSYVENALPAVAGARYTEHLAECASCRKLVAQLSTPVSLVNEEVSKVSEISGIRKLLASLFTPMVLRYAVPALGLIVVAAIGFTILRRQERQAGTSVAQLNEQQPQQPVVGSNAQAPSPSSGAVNSYDDKKKSAVTTPQPNAGKPNTVPAPPPNAPPSVSVSADVKQEATKPKENQQAAAKAPEPTPTAIPAPTVADAVRVEPEKRAQARIAPARDETKKTAEAGTATAAAPASNKAFQIRGRVDAMLEKDKNEAETRSVGGRRFRKEKGVWIDTAYESSRATVNLTRGSEQYRALVADEPTIKTIAEQLDGEIIVVWKGHAYHIR